MGASITPGALIREGRLMQFNSVEGAFISEEEFIWKWAFIRPFAVHYLYTPYPSQE